MPHSDENYTPSYFIDPIRDFAGGFTLDPFSCADANATIKAERYFTQTDDALSYDWHNLLLDDVTEPCVWVRSEQHETVWCNPPYSRKLVAPCVRKFLDYMPENEGFLLLNSSTSSQIYHRAFNLCDAILFPRKRINFLNPYKENTSSNEYDQTLFYYGCRAEKFVKHMVDTCSGMTAL